MEFKHGVSVIIPLYKKADTVRRAIDRIGELPAAQRTVFVNQIGDLAYSLWDAGALEEFKRVIARVRLSDGFGAKGGRMAKLGAVPFPVLWFLWRLRYSSQYWGTSS